MGRSIAMDAAAGEVLMVSTINLNDRSQYPLVNVPQTADVWVKSRWADSWTRRPDLYAVQSVWSMAPAVSTTTLEYRYGRVLVPGARDFQNLSRITSRGYFVLVRWRDANNLPIDWLGYAETPVTRDRTFARDGLPESGKQTIPCFSLWRALEQCYVDNSVYVDPSNETDAKRSGGTGSIFNEGMRGNRSAQKRKLDGEGAAAYVFASPNDDTSTWWSTRDIIEHLATFHLPTPASVAQNSGVPWSVNNLDVLPTWDRPSLDSDLRSVASILSSLITPQNMLGFGIGARITGTDIPNVSSVTINPFSLLADPLTLPLGTLPANTDQFNLQWTTDPLTDVTVDEDSTGVVDQVVVQGPREITVTTLYAWPTTSAPYEKGWTTEDEDEYSDGARLWGSFATASIEQKRSMNERFRTTGKMRDVFSMYRWKKDWDGTIGGHPMFFTNEDGNGDPVVYAPSPLGVEVLDYLPLYAEVNYSGDPSEVDESNGLTLRKPFLSFRKRTDNNELIDDRFYVDRDGRLGVPEELMKSSPLEIGYEIDEKLNVRLIVRDAPQHALAGKEFVGNLGDLDQETLFGNLYHEGWSLTVAVRGDRRPRYFLPSQEAVADLDVVRRKIVTLDDDSLASVHITEGTFVGWANNTPLTTTSDGGLLRDPTPILESLCRMLAKQHGQPRRRANIKTGRRLAMLQLGSMINLVESAGGPVEAVISQVRIDAPMTEGQAKPASPTQSFVASPYQTDIMNLLRTPTGNAQRPQQKRKYGEKRVIKPRSERRPIVPLAQRQARRGIQ
jgi:hypothetical protein